ncbi:MAG: hypothetical protein ACRDAM_09895 [Casimicrobium sp.]
MANEARGDTSPVESRYSREADVARTADDWSPSGTNDDAATTRETTTKLASMLSKLLKRASAEVEETRKPTISEALQNLDSLQNLAEGANSAQSANTANDNPIMKALSDILRGQQLTEQGQQLTEQGMDVLEDAANGTTSKAAPSDLSKQLEDLIKTMSEKTTQAPESNGLDESIGAALKELISGLDGDGSDKAIQSAMNTLVDGLTQNGGDAGDRHSVTNALKALTEGLKNGGGDDADAITKAINELMPALESASGDTSALDGTNAADTTEGTTEANASQEDVAKLLEDILSGESETTPTEASSTKSALAEDQSNTDQALNGEETQALLGIIAQLMMYLVKNGERTSDSGVVGLGNKQTADAESVEA